MDPDLYAQRLDLKIEVTDTTKKNDNNKGNTIQQEYRGKTIDVGIFFDITQIHEAARRGLTEEIQSAYERNKDSIGTMDETGNTPLHWAAHHGNFETVGLLLQLGVDMSATNDDGNTPLHLAALHSHPKICELFMKIGKDSLRFVKNKQNKSPLDLAVSHEVKIALSHKNELHRWSKHKSKDLMLYVHGLSKETDCARRKQILHKHFENIEVCEHLMMVIFKDCAIDDNDIQIFAEVIKKHPTIADINLNNNKITNRGAYFLIDAINNTKAPLNQIHLHGNKNLTSMQRIEVEIALRELSIRQNPNIPDPATLPPLRILCLDGGGMKGIVLVKMLQKIEELCGVHFSQLFDMICGTSTGGLIALSQMVTPKKTLTEMREMYMDLGKKIFTYHFGGKSPIVGAFHKVSGRGYYDTNKFEQQLKDNFKDEGLYKPDHDPKVFVVSTCSRKSLGKFLFTSYDYKQSVLHSRAPKEAKLWEAARATSAAPTFFDSFKYEEEVLLDGAMVANNPTEVALQEVRYLWPKRKIGVVVSLGTGVSANVSSTLGEKITPKILQHLKDIVTDTKKTHESVSSQFVTLNQLGENVNYYRLNPKVAKKYPLDVTSEQDLRNLESDTTKYVNEMMHDTFVDLCNLLKKYSNISGRVAPDIDMALSSKSNYTQSNIKLNISNNNNNNNNNNNINNSKNASPESQRLTVTKQQKRKNSSLRKSQKRKTKIFNMFGKEEKDEVARGHNSMPLLEDKKGSVKDLVEQYHKLSRRDSSDSPVQKKLHKEKPTETCVAIVDYESNVEGDLSFNKGDEMVVLEKHPNGWLECGLNGKMGWVSGKHVSITRTRSKTNIL